LKKSLWIILSILLLDQVLKIWIKTHMFLGQEFQIADWFIIHFTENNGMAFGFEFGGIWGKLALSLFRLAAIGALGYFLYTLEKKKAPTTAIVALSLILAGAIGNMIDSAFYGLIFNESLGQVASFMPEEGGYAGFLQGRVVDMFYFPIYSGYLPEWIPFWGGDYMVFFRPVFNIADTAISTGIGIVIFFQRNIFNQ
jgi:signal peptidase II